MLFREAARIARASLEGPIEIGPSNNDGRRVAEFVACEFASLPIRIGQ
jgi:hypothetical protein